MQGWSITEPCLPPGEGRASGSQARAPTSLHPVTTDTGRLTGRSHRLHPQQQELWTGQRPYLVINLGAVCKPSER